LGFPLLPLFLGLYLPATMVATNSMKPITQVISHVPQLVECVKLKTTRGVSLTSHHLNFIGGVLGLYMCWEIPPVASTTYLIYSNSIFQALSIYSLAIYYGEFDLFPLLSKGVENGEAKKESEKKVLETRKMSSNHNADLT